MYTLKREHQRILDTIDNALKNSFSVSLNDVAFKAGSTTKQVAWVARKAGYNLTTQGVMYKSRNTSISRFSNQENE